MSTLPKSWRKIARGLAPALVIALWGSATVLSALSLREIGPMAVSFWRWAWALPLLWGVVLFSGEGRDVWPTIRLYPLQLLSVGLSGVTALYAFQNLALQHTSAFNVSLFIELTPVFIALLGMAVLKEYPALRMWLGIGLGFAGAALLTLGATSVAEAPGNAHTALGDVLALGAAVAGAVYTVYGKVMTRRISPALMLTLGATAGLLMLLPLAWQEDAFWPKSGWVWAYLIILGLGAGAFGNLWWFHELTHRPAAQLSAILFVTALVAAGLAVLILGDPLTPWLLAGGALVIIGARLVK